MIQKNETCREASARNWTSKGTNEDINSGSLQRIADALERSNAHNKELIDRINSIHTMYFRKVKTMSGKLSNLQARITKLETKCNENGNN